MREKYIIDANVFITAKRDYYSFDIAPTFWSQLNMLASQGVVSIIDKVKAEIVLEGSIDDLGLWVKNEYHGKVLSSKEPEVIEAYMQIITHVVRNPRYKESAKSEFASVADSWLLAHALSNKYTIVTLETFDSQCINRVKIPNVCKEFNIPYVNLFEMLRNERLKL